MEVKKLIKNLYLIVVLICQLLTINLLYGSNSGTTAIEFLKMGIGARPFGMGEAFAGLSDDINSMYYNPAGLLNLKKIELSAMHTFWFEDIFYSNISFAYPLFNGVLGIGINYLSTGKIQKADNKGTILNEFYRPEDMVGVLSFSREIKGIKTGGNIKFISSKIEEESAKGIAIDLGILYKILNNLDLGFSIQNIGTKIKYVKEVENLPLNFKLGISYKFKHRLVSVLDYDYISNSLRIGGEYRVKINKFNLSSRIGYRTNTPEGFITGLSIGFGIIFKEKYSIDYAWSGFGELGEANRISLSFIF